MKKIDLPAFAKYGMSVKGIDFCSNERGDSLWEWKKCTDAWTTSGQPVWAWKQFLGGHEFIWSGNRNTDRSRIIRSRFYE